MESVKYYHLFTGELAEGRGGLGRISLVLSADFDRVTAERNALQLLLNNRDDLDDQLTSLEQRRYAEQQAREAAERRVEELAGLLRQSDDFMYIMTGNDTQRDLDAKYGRLLWEDAIVNLRGMIAAALNPTAEAVSNDEPQCLLCLDKKTVQGNIPGGFVKDCPDCCGEEG